MTQPANIDRARSKLQTMTFRKLQKVADEFGIYVDGMTKKGMVNALAGHSGVVEKYGIAATAGVSDDDAA